jgi:hypothetical protein
VLDGLSASLACAVRLLVGGVPKPQGEAEVAARSIRAAAGEGKTGRVGRSGRSGVTVAVDGFAGFGIETEAL